MVVEQVVRMGESEADVAAKYGIERKRLREWLRYFGMPTEPIVRPKSAKTLRDEAKHASEQIRITNRIAELERLILETEEKMRLIMARGNSATESQ